MHTKPQRPGQTAPRVLSRSDRPRRECVISLATAGTPFPGRLARLHESLTQTGFGGDVVAWTPGRFPEGCPSHLEAPFAFKPFCFAHARSSFADDRRGHRLALWMDASCVAVRPLDALFEHIATKGYLLFQNGRYKVGEWAGDAALEYFGMERDEALKIDEVNAAVIGLDLGNPLAITFLDLWHTAARDELPLRGVKEVLRDGDDYAAVKWNRDGRVSADPRVRGHRHDQTAAGIIASRLGMALTVDGLQAYPREGVRDIREETSIIIDRYEVHPCPATLGPFGAEG